MRNATKKASVTGPAPNARAITMSRAYPRIRLASVASPMAPTALTTPCWTASVVSPRAASLTGMNSLTPRRPDGMVVCRPSANFQEARRRGQHAFRDQADEAEREAAPAQPRGAERDPHGREERAHGDRGQGAGGQGRGSRGDPHARSSGEPRDHAPEQRRAQEIVARQEAERARLNS